jgi:hypothetical protein
VRAIDAAGKDMDEDADGIAEGRGGSAALPRLSARAWVAVGAGLAALIAIAAMVGLRMAEQPVRWQNVGFTVDSPFEARATYDVFLYTDEPVDCQVRALDVRFAVVGAATERVLPSDGEHQRITTTVTTTETANTVVVEYCGLAE